MARFLNAKCGCTHFDIWNVGQIPWVDYLSLVQIDDLERQMSG